MKSLTLAAAVALVVLSFSVPAAAQSPAGGWAIQLSVDSGAPAPTPAIGEICLLNNGSWYSPNYHWSGLWYYTGGPVRLLGNFSPNGSIAMELTLVNGQLMVGTSTQWTGNSSSQTDVSWARAVFTRLYRCWVVG